MGTNDTTIDTIRARLAPHGILLRGVLHFDGDGPELRAGGRAGTVILLGNIGGSIWPAFKKWRAGNLVSADPLDAWSMETIGPVADELGATAWFPSEKPWQPFQQWAMKAEGLRPSPLGILIHPDYGLWHGYRGALGFAERIGASSRAVGTHPCDHCLEKPCLKRCPVGAVTQSSFNLAGCRSHLQTEAGQAGCVASGCLARNACPVGAGYRYPEEQLKFHMAALS